MTSAALSPGMAALWLFGGFFVLLVLRVPVAFSLGLVLVVTGMWHLILERFGVELD